MLEDVKLEKAGIKRIDNVHDVVKRVHLGAVIVRSRGLRLAELYST
jgi:hypothetical protein